MSLNQEYRRLVELERQHGPTASGSVGQTQTTSSTPRAFKFSKRKDSKRVNKVQNETNSVNI